MRSIHASIKTALIVSAALLVSAAFAQAATFDWDNFQSDIHGVAKQTDPNLVNPWGMALAPSGPVWVNDNGTGAATVYNQDGTPVPNATNPLVVTIPPSASNTEGTSAPTG